MVGSRLKDRYTITAELGAGAMGQVFLARDEQTGEQVAIKVLPPALAKDKKYLSRFEREAQALHELNHPNIVPYIDSFREGSHQYLVMAYMPGGSLHDRLEKEGALAIDEARRIAMDLTDALIRAHRLGIIHRDIKPENILFDADGVPRLSDFGVAGIEAAEGTRLTGTGGQIGTPYYMSPEAWQGEPQDVQSDIWSLGVVIYEMLAGSPPFVGKSAIALMREILQTQAPDLLSVRKDVPAGLYQIIRKALAKERAQRYQSMRDLGADLERGKPALPLKGSGMSVPLGARRVGGIGVLAILLILLAVILLGFFLTRNGEEETHLLSPTPTDTSIPKSTNTVTLTPATRVPVEPCAEGLCAVVVGMMASFCDGRDPIILCLTDERGIQTTEIDTGLQGWEASEDSITWSPDGKRLVFSICSHQDCAPSGDGQLYIANADGTSITPLPDFGHDLLPMWSPDGEWIAFVANDDLYLIHPDGSDAHLIFEGQDYLRIPHHPIRWSPDSQWIAIIAANTRNRAMPSVIWAMRPDGSDVQVVHTSGPDTQQGFNMVWTPDGKQLIVDYAGKYIAIDTACLATQDCGEDDYSPYTGDIDYQWFPTYYPQWGIPPASLVVESGTIANICEGKQPVTLCLSNERGEAIGEYDTGLRGNVLGNVTWSPDGEQVTFSVCSGKDCSPLFDGQLYVANADGTSLTALPRSSNDNDANWSPDGEWIAFHSGCDLRSIRPDGSDVRLLVDSMDGTRCVYRIRWSPDSQWLAIVTAHTTEPAPSSVIWTVRPDGSDLQVFHPSGPNVTQNFDIAWTPDGKQLIVDYSGSFTAIDTTCLETQDCGEDDYSPYSGGIDATWLPNYYPQWGRGLD